MKIIDFMKSTCTFNSVVDFSRTLPNEPTNKKQKNSQSIHLSIITNPRQILDAVPLQTERATTHSFSQALTPHLTNWCGRRCGLMRCIDARLYSNYYCDILDTLQNDVACYREARLKLLYMLHNKQYLQFLQPVESASKDTGHYSCKQKRADSSIVRILVWWRHFFTFNN